MAGIGKIIGRRQYLTASQTQFLDAPSRNMLEAATSLVTQRGADTYNVFRIDLERNEVAFLHYPLLGYEPFPSLASSWRVHLPTGLVSFRDFQRSLNPPILHRTELLLAEDHPARELCVALTQTCEQVGLFAKTSIIGFRSQWSQLIRTSGFELADFELRPIGNAVFADETVSSVPGNSEISRHRTALSRTALSAPVQSLIRDGLLTRSHTFFDYGCGKGDDLGSLLLDGFTGSGWDPYFRADSPRHAADVVNIGFVINVIEDKTERVEALEGAFELANQVLVVAAMLGGPTEATAGRYFRDGVVTSRNTFQKYYSQAELQQFLELVLDHDAYPAAPGVFYIFKDRAVELAYLLEKSSDRSRVARARLASVTGFRPRRSATEGKQIEPEAPAATAYLETLWATCLQFGREPVGLELPSPELAVEFFGSARRAINACITRNDPAPLVRAGDGRRNDILVMLALQFFGRRRRFGELERHFQQDIRTFFGSLGLAEAKAQALLFSVQDKSLIAAAVIRAAADGLGWLVPGESLQLHTSLVERLPAILRVYIGCATTLVGQITAFDLIKVHVDSGKVTLLSFDDFSGSPIPALHRRIKVRLRDQDMDIFDYGGAHEPSVLYYKSRYINEEFEHYADQVAFEEALEDLGAFDLSGYGLTVEKFYQRLTELRFEVFGFELRRSTRIPSLDDSCGATFTFRQLIECGETWSQTHTENLPVSPDSYNALFDLTKEVLDPVVDYFGAIKLTYGFASDTLTKRIPSRIAPKIDQHASCEKTHNGAFRCDRLGAAVDFLVEDEDMLEVARWIHKHCAYDRMYFYGPIRPLHVSVGPDNSRQAYAMVDTGGRLMPRKLDLT